MATPNYSYEKRQRELAKKRKAEEKRQKKVVPGDPGSGNDGNNPPDAGSNAGVMPTPVPPAT